MGLHSRPDHCVLYLIYNMSEHVATAFVLSKLPVNSYYIRRLSILIKRQLLLQRVFLILDIIYFTIKIKKTSHNICCLNLSFTIITTTTFLNDILYKINRFIKKTHQKNTAIQWLLLLWGFFLYQRRFKA